MKSIILLTFCFILQMLYQWKRVLASNPDLKGQLVVPTVITNTKF